MLKQRTVKEAKNFWYYTSILDKYPKATIQKLYTNHTGKLTIYKVIDISNRFILKVAEYGTKELREYDVFKAKYVLHSKMAKITKNVLRPIDFKERKEEITYVEALYELKEKDVTDLIGKIDAQTTLKIIKLSLEPLFMLTEGNNFHYDIRPENILFEDNRIIIIEYGEQKSECIPLKDIKTKHLSYYTEAYCPLEVHLESANGSANLSKVDVYSWGMTIYQMISGKTVEELNEEVKLYKRDERKYDEFLKIVKGIQLSNDKDGSIAKQLIPMLLKVLSKNPNERPSFKELYAEFKPRKDEETSAEGPKILVNIRQQINNELKKQAPNFGNAK